MLATGAVAARFSKSLPSVKITALDWFDFTDGGEPFARLIPGTSGAFYGTTFDGGDVGYEGCSGGCGTTFKVSSGGHSARCTSSTSSTAGWPIRTDPSYRWESLGRSPEGISGDSELFKVALPRTSDIDGLGRTRIDVQRSIRCGLLGPFSGKPYCRHQQAPYKGKDSTVSWRIHGRPLPES